MLADREAQELGEHERRKVVDGVLRVVLRERKDAELPLQRHTRRENDRRGLRRREPGLLGELEVLFGVVARDEGLRRVIEVGQIFRLPFQEAGRRREVDLRSGERHVNRRRDDVAVSESFDVA